ncbi:hypothetical protein [Streptomyces sp. CB02923]|uniref:hypothetical protein n=1 Tax=Streptomyces sp. CB02923 TaxID=1718985 RepID=UPI000A4E2400|nr:hypothetical protein [Streptomyces sp. CB02923]
MTALRPEVPVEEEFPELDELEVIDSKELKLGGSYHAYVYIAAEDVFETAD